MVILNDCYVCVRLCVWLCAQMRREIDIVLHFAEKWWKNFLFSFSLVNMLIAQWSEPTEMISSKQYIHAQTSSTFKYELDKIRIKCIMANETSAESTVLVATEQVTVRGIDAWFHSNDYELFALRWLPSQMCVKSAMDESNTHLMNESNNKHFGRAVSMQLVMLKFKLIVFCKLCDFWLNHNADQLSIHDFSHFAYKYFSFAAHRSNRSHHIDQIISRTIHEYDERTHIDYIIFSFR